MAKAQCVVFLFMCCLVFHLNCFVISSDDDRYYYEGKQDKTDCYSMSDCIMEFGEAVCKSIPDLVCGGNENSTTTEEYSYFPFDTDTDNNSTFNTNDHPYPTYSHLSPSTWGYIIMIKIFIIMFLRVFCCNYHRRSVLFIPSTVTSHTCHEVSNPMSNENQQDTDTSELSRCPLSTVAVESSRQKDDPPPPPYTATVAASEILPPPDYNVLFPKGQSPSSQPPSSC